MSANGQFWEVLLLLVSSGIVLSWIWSYIERQVRPRIYFLPEKSLFLYSKGSQRVLFDYLSLMKSEANGSFFGGINRLSISKPNELNESNSYLVFDRNDEAIAIMPYSARYSTNKRDLILVGPDKKEKWLGIDEFISDQITIRHTMSAHSKSSAESSDSNAA